MLAQTQVDRVAPKFQEFVRRFPDFGSLAAASLADVLREWRGLGYNVRAVRLHRLAKDVVEHHGGALPLDAAALRSLPGIGRYTTAAIRAFAFNLDDAPVDTNVARVVKRLGGGEAHSLLPKGRAHDWSSAMMDLGATICTARAPKCLICPLRADCASAPFDASEVGLEGASRPAKDSIRFERTVRYARGRIIDRLRDLPSGQRISLLDLHADINWPSYRSIEDVRDFVAALERDGLVSCDGNGVALRE
jgi:A/G-specific adenine glycosylase